MQAWLLRGQEHHSNDLVSLKCSGAARLKFVGRNCAARKGQRLLNSGLPRLKNVSVIVALDTAVP
jgi:hypothetical protein